jgi:hypothetical protein
MFTQSTTLSDRPPRQLLLHLRENQPRPRRPNSSDRASASMWISAPLSPWSRQFRTKLMKASGGRRSISSRRATAAIVVWPGKTTGAQVDRLPHGGQDLAGVAAVLGDVGSGAELEEHYHRTARRARAVMERLFYGEG